MTLSIADTDIFEFVLVEGTVLEASSQTATEISGGGGTIVYGIGQFNPITTKHTTTSTIWLQTDDGTQLPFKTSNFEVTCRPGNRLTAIAVKDRHKTNGEHMSTVVAFYNNTTRTLSYDPWFGKGVAYASLPKLRKGGVYMGALWLIFTLRLFYEQSFARTYDFIDVCGILILSAVVGGLLWIPSALITMPQVTKRNRALRRHIEKAVRTMQGNGDGGCLRVVHSIAS